jgi:hypothetical protein
MFFFFSCTSRKKKRRIKTMRSAAPNPFQGRLVELLIKSEDRDRGSALNNAHFTFQPPIPNVQSIRFGWFQMYNLFPNIQEDENVLAVFQAGVPPVAFPASVVFPVGRWVCGLGRVTNVDVRTVDTAAGAPSIYLNDIRYFLIRSFEGAVIADDAIVAVTLDPVTGLLSIQWNATYTAAGATPITNDPALSTIYAQLGFPATVTTGVGVTWTATSVLDLGDPLSVALSGYVGQNSITNIVTSMGPARGGSRSNYFAVIPINSPPNAINFYEPYEPVTIFTAGSGNALIDVQIAIVDPVTDALVPMSAQQQWQLKLVLNIDG